MGCKMCLFFIYSCLVIWCFRARAKQRSCKYIKFGSCVGSRGSSWQMWKRKFGSLEQAFTTLLTEENELSSSFQFSISAWSKLHHSCNSQYRSLSDTACPNATGYSMPHCRTGPANTARCPALCEALAMHCAEQKLDLETRQMWT